MFKGQDSRVRLEAACAVFLDCATCGGGADSLGNLDKDFSSWELVLRKEVRLLGG